MSGADLRHVEAWIFDLDNTLYPADGELTATMDRRITAFVQRQTGLDAAEAFRLQRRYLDEHGTTLAGLMALHGVDPHAYLEEVHDVSLDSLAPDPALRAGIARLPGRRLVFTNASARHAERVLERLALADLFDDVFHLETADLIPKPRPETFERFIRAHAVRPSKAAFFEDSERNLKPAAEIGMTTVLVGPHATASQAPFVQFRTDDLARFLGSARVQETAA